MCLRWRQAIILLPGSVLNELSLAHMQWSAMQMLLLLKLGLTVLATFGIVWAPFLMQPGVAGAVLSRLVPLKRGLFEDYVANFWCATSMVIKWKRLLSLAVQSPCAAACHLSTTVQPLYACVHNSCIAGGLSTASPLNMVLHR